MRRLSLLLVLTLLAMLLAAPAAQAAGKSPFTGAWTGNDPAPPDGDGSTLYLTISGGKTLRVTFIDTFGSICDNFGAPTNVFASRLIGSASGDTLDATFTAARCGPVFFDFLAGEPVTYEYDSATDTLSDGFVTFHRVGG